MTKDELKEMCKNKIEMWSGVPRYQPMISLIQPGRWGKRNYRLLFGVKGEILQENVDNTLMVLYPANELLEAVQKLEGI